MSTPSQECWLVVKTKPRQELRARENLANQGFNVYLPFIALRKRLRGQWKLVSEPLFPGYLFILVDPSTVSLAPVRSTLGVSGLVTFGHQVVPIPSSVIDFIRARDAAAQGGSGTAPSPFSPGEPVRVLTGPFAGLAAIYEMTGAKDRASVLVTLLGRQNRVSVSLDAIVPEG